MATEEQKAENKRVFESRHAGRKYRRASYGEIEQMRCTTCGERPWAKLTDFDAVTHQKCVMLVCGCKEKSQWFTIVGEYK